MAQQNLSYLFKEHCCVAKSSGSEHISEIHTTNTTKTSASCGALKLLN